MLGRSLDLVVEIAYCIVAACVLALAPWSAAIDWFLVPLVLFSPGYAIICCLERTSDELGWGRRFLLALTLSLTLLVIGGLLLNIDALDRHTWGAGLIGVSLAASLVALGRRARTWPRPHARFRRLSRRTLPGGRASISTAIVGGLLLGGSVAITEVSARHAYDAPLTEVSAVEVSGGQMERLAVTNLSSGLRRYAVTLTTSRPGGTRHSEESRVMEVAIGPSQTWTRLEPRRYSRTVATVSSEGIAGGRIGAVSWHG